MAKKKWFLDYLCAYVAKSVIREFCDDMELTPLETRLIMERFCDKKGMLACEDFYSVDCQKAHLPILDKKVRGWVERNIGKFKPSEIVGIYKFMAEADDPDL